MENTDAVQGLELTTENWAHLREGVNDERRTMRDDQRKKHEATERAESKKK